MSSELDLSFPESNELLSQMKRDHLKREIRNARKEHFSASSMGFKQRYRKKLKFEPEWMTILNDAGINYRKVLSNLNNDDIFDFFHNEDIVFKLTDNEMTQLKTLLKDQMVLESDLKMGSIKWSEEVYNLISKLARTNGDLSELSPKLQAAILTLVQFNNITPAFGDDYNEIAIETCLEDSNEFVEFTDVLGSEIYVRKASFVKSQILEEKIIDELHKHRNQSEKWSNFMLFSGILYFFTKAILIVVAWLYNGTSSGYSIIMAETNEDNSKI